MIWIAQLKDGNPTAAQQLWDTYFLRMVKAARCKLHGAPGGMADEEDVALSAFKSFCRGTQNGRFPQLQEHEDPWPLLAGAHDSQGDRSAAVRAAGEAGRCRACTMHHLWAPKWRPL